MFLSIYWLVTIGKIGKQEEVQGVEQAPAPHYSADVTFSRVLFFYMSAQLRYKERGCCCDMACLIESEIVQVVDLEPMVAKFGHPSMCLRDNIHPHMFFNIEIFNIYLNILRDHGRLLPSITEAS